VEGEVWAKEIKGRMIKKTRRKEKEYDFFMMIFSCVYFLPSQTVKKI
jgi:hypothetical protein